MCYNGFVKNSAELIFVLLLGRGFSMKSEFNFSYRSNLYRISVVLLQNFIAALFCLPVFPIVNSVMILLFECYLIDDNLVLFLILPSLLVFAALTAVYFFGKKGITLNQKDLLISYCCVNPGVHSFAKRIKYSDITDVGLSNEKIDWRLQETDGGDYCRDYAVIHYKKNKSVYLSVENIDEFIENLKIKVY